MDTAELEVPPHDPDAESSLVGAILMGEDLAGLEAVRRIVGPSDCYQTPAKHALRAIFDMADQQLGIDLTLLRAEIEHLEPDMRERVRTYTMEACDACPSPALALDYARRVRAMSDRRDLLRVGLELQHGASNGKATSDVLRDAEAVLQRIRGDGEESATARMGEPWTIEDVFQRAKDGTRWLVDGYIQVDGLHMLSAGSGVGKSWLLAYLIGCGERGEPFLGRKVEPFTTTWCSEESAYTLAEKIKPFGLRKVAIYGREHLDRAGTWQELLREVAGRARSRGDGLLAVDPFATWGNFEGDAEQGSGPMTRAMRPAMAEARGGLSVALLHHDTKAGNPFRGSGSIKGALDVGAWLRLLDSGDQEGPRLLSIEKARPDHCAKPVVLEKRYEAGRATYEVLGNPSEARAMKDAPTVVEALRESEPEGISANQLAGDLGLRKGDVLATLKAAGAYTTGSGPKTRWHPAK